jgi:hypothetical protein
VLNAPPELLLGFVSCVQQALQILSNNKHAQRRDDSLNQERTEAPNGSGDTQGNHPDVVVEKIDVSWHILIMRARQVIMLE